MRINDRSKLAFIVLIFIVSNLYVSNSHSQADSPLAKLTTNDLQSTVIFNQGSSKYEGILLTESIRFIDPLNLQESQTEIAAELKPFSRGLFKRKFFSLVTLKIYTAEFFVKDIQQSKLILANSPDSFISSTQDISPVALKMTFLRDIDGPKLESIFKESLLKNLDDQILSSEHVTEFLKFFKSLNKISKESTFTLIGYKHKTGSSLLIHSSLGLHKKIKGDLNFTSDIFKIWFGEPSDEKMASLKKDLTR